MQSTGASPTALGFNPRFPVPGVQAPAPTARASASEIQALDRLASQRPVNGPAIMRFMAERDPEVKYLLAEHSATPHPWTIFQHTERVYDVLNEQLRFLDIPSLGLPADVDLPKLLALTVALHDIGKPYAAQQDNNDLQHTETPPIMARVLRYFGRNENEIAIACALISQDAVGETSRSWRAIPTATARQEIQHAFAGTPVRTPEAQFRLQAFFYTIDCGSYPDLRRSEFRNTGGRLIPNKPGFDALAQSYGVTDY